jgi:hypothetical protein
MKKITIVMSDPLFNKMEEMKNRFGMPEGMLLSLAINSIHEMSKARPEAMFMAKEKMLRENPGHSLEGCKCPECGKAIPEGVLAIPDPLPNPPTDPRNN